MSNRWWLRWLICICSCETGIWVSFVSHRVWVSVVWVCCLHLLLAGWLVGWLNHVAGWMTGFGCSDVKMLCFTAEEACSTCWNDVWHLPIDPTFVPSFDKDGQRVNWRRFQIWRRRENRSFVTVAIGRVWDIGRDIVDRLCVVRKLTLIHWWRRWWNCGWYVIMYDGITRDHLWLLKIRLLVALQLSHHWGPCCETGLTLWVLD